MNVVQLKSKEELEKTLQGNGILTIWVDWSIGFLNCKKLIQYLEENNSKETVYVINIDLIYPEKQIELFGKVLHGWGEIFVFEKGKTPLARICNPCFHYIYPHEKSLVLAVSNGSSDV